MIEANFERMSVNEIARMVLEKIGDRSPAFIHIQVEGDEFKMQVGNAGELPRETPKAPSAGEMFRSSASAPSSPLPSSNGPSIGGGGLLNAVNAAADQSKKDAARVGVT